MKGSHKFLLCIDVGSLLCCSLLEDCLKSHSSLRDQLLTAPNQRIFDPLFAFEMSMARFPYLEDQIGSGMLQGHPFALQWSAPRVPARVSKPLLPVFHPEGVHPIQGV